MTGSDEFGFQSRPITPREIQEKPTRVSLDSTHRHHDFDMIAAVFRCHHSDSFQRMRMLLNDERLMAVISSCASGIDDLATGVFRSIVL